MLIRARWEEGSAGEQRLEASQYLLEKYFPWYMWCYHWGQDSLTNYSVTLSYLPFPKCHTSFSYLGRNCCLFQRVFSSSDSSPLFLSLGPFSLTPSISAHTVPPRASVKVTLSICLAPLEAESLLRCGIQFLFIIISLMPIIVCETLKAFGDCWMAKWKKSYHLKWQSMSYFIKTHFKPLHSRLCVFKLNYVRVK